MPLLQFIYISKAISKVCAFATIALDEITSTPVSAISFIVSIADALIRQRTCVMLELLKRKNVTLHDFQTDTDIVTRHDYFSDVQHFSNEAAKVVLKKLKQGTNLLSTPAEVRANEEKLRRLIRQNMPVYYKHLKEIK